MRLVTLLAEHPATTTPGTNALGALMYLHAARIPSRVDPAGELHALWDQDRSRWNRDLIAQGRVLLDRSAAGAELTPYHIEAAIAAVHATAPSLEQTDWNAIVVMYDRLMTVAPSPVVALNRAIAIAERDGAERGIEAIEAIEDRERLEAYPFYPAALGELEARRGNLARAREHFDAAARLARNESERKFLEKRARSCEDASGAPVER
jgi:RNA polymerase sigma-70 factor (ECF subfamily)